MITRREEEDVPGSCSSYSSPLSLCSGHPFTTIISQSSLVSLSFIGSNSSGSSSQLS